MGGETARRFASDEVMGEGSYVIVRPLSLGELRDLREQAKGFRDARLKEIKAELMEINRNPGPASEELVQMLSEERADLLGDLSMNVGWDVVAARIKEWNWEDAEGNALPVPEGDPAVLDCLDMAAINFLIDAIYGSAAQVKKS